MTRTEMPTSTVGDHLTRLGSDFAQKVGEFVEGFGPEPGAGHHFALRVHVSATTEGLPIGASVVEIGLTMSVLEIKNVDTGETAEFTFRGVDVNAGKGLDASPVDVSVGSGQWVQFDTVEAVRVEDFAGAVRMPSAEVFGQELSHIVLPVNIDQGDLLGDLARGDAVDISDATVDVPDLVSVSEKIGEMTVTRIYEGTPDHSRDLFAGPHVQALMQDHDTTSGTDDAPVGHPGDDEARTAGPADDGAERVSYPGDDAPAAGPVDDGAERVSYPGDDEASAYPVSTPSEESTDGGYGDGDGG